MRRKGIFGKAFKATLGAGIGCLVLLLGVVIIGAALSTAARPTGSLTPTLPTSTSTIPPAAGAKTWAVVKSWTGEGIKDTETFTVGSEWRIDWDFAPRGTAGIIQIFIYDERGQIVNLAANTQKAGADSSFQHRAGTYYLQINSANGSWKVAVQDQR